MTTKCEKTDEEIKQEVARIQEEIGHLKERAREQGLAFSCLEEEQLIAKVKGETSNSPFITGQSWTSGTSPGSSASYTVHVQNPDPIGYFPFYASIYFGLGNFLSVGEGWAGRDKRWPDFSSDRTFLAANASASFTFNYTTPTGLPLGTYNGNTVVWKGDWHDTGVSFDIGSFDVRLF